MIPAPCYLLVVILNMINYRVCFVVIALMLLVEVEYKINPFEATRRYIVHTTFSIEDYLGILSFATI